MRGPAVLQPLQQPQEAAHLPPVRGEAPGGAGSRPRYPPRPAYRPRAALAEPEAWRAGPVGPLSCCWGGVRPGARRRRRGPGTGGVPNAGSPAPPRPAWARGETAGEAEQAAPRRAAVPQGWRGRWAWRARLWAGDTQLQLSEAFWLCIPSLSQRLPRSPGQSAVQQVLSIYLPNILAE